MNSLCTLRASTVRDFSLPTSDVHTRSSIQIIPIIKIGLVKQSVLNCKYGYFFYRRSIHSSVSAVCRAKAHKIHFEGLTIHFSLINLRAAEDACFPDRQYTAVSGKALPIVRHNTSGDYMCYFLPAIAKYALQRVNISWWIDFSPTVLICHFCTRQIL